jgi:hypothetical protein
MLINIGGPGVVQPVGVGFSRLDSASWRRRRQQRRRQWRRRAAAGRAAIASGPALIRFLSPLLTGVVQWPAARHWAHNAAHRRGTRCCDRRARKG